MAKKPTYEELEQRVKELDKQAAEHKRTEEELQREKERAEQYFNIAEIGLAIVASNENITYINKKGCEILKYNQEELIGKNWFDVLVPSSMREEVRGAFGQLMAGNVEPVEFCENPLLTKDGEERLIGFHNTVIRDQADQIVGTLFSAEDITERKRAEEALRESEKGILSILDNSPEMILRLDIDLNILWGNKTARDVNPDLLGKRCYEAFIGIKEPCEGCPCKKAMEAGKIEMDTVYHSTMKGVRAESYWECIGVPVNDNQGEIIGGIKIARNVTERKRAEEELKKHRDHLEELVKEHTAELRKRNKQLQQEIIERKQAEALLRESEEKYSTLVEESLTGVYISQDGRIEFANDKFAKIHGYIKEELLGMESWKLIHPEDRAMAREITRKMLTGEDAPSEYEAKGLTKDGKTIWVTRRNTVMKYKGKLAILGNIVDITKRKQMEENLRESEKELRLLSSQLLSAEEKERKRIAQELHDGIGQSLSAIKFTAESTLKQIGEGTFNTSAKLLKAIIPLTQKTIEEVRRIVMDLRPSTLDDLGILPTISWFCREFQAIYKDIQIEKQINVEESDIPGPLKIVIYRVLQEAFNNIAKNSQADFVRFSLRKINGRVEMDIEDNGKGLDLKATRSKENTKRGFGLTSMRERTNLSGGSFSIHSSVGQGTLVRSSWPVSEVT